jgi:stage III sporulation protein AG
MNGLGKLLKDLKTRLKKYGSKKIIEKAVIVAIVGVICLIAGSVLFEDTLKKTGDTPASSTARNQQSNPADSTAAETMKQTNGGVKSETEEKLRSILSQIKGAGKVDVMITFVSGSESVPAVDVNSTENSTQEKDKEGGSRDIKENNKQNSIVYEENQGVKKPFVVKEILPKVKGVVIVAEGAGDAEVKNNLTRAAQALLEVAAHKVQVFQKSGN